MSRVLHHNEDGANRQAQAVLAIFQCLLCDGIEESWDAEYHRYTADIQVARWENCREQGYILSLTTKNFKKQLCIAFFEHRNVDSVCAVKWEQKATINTPTITTADFGDIYDDKYDTSFDVPFGEPLEMAKWMLKEFTNFYKESAKVVDSQ